MVDDFRSLKDSLIRVLMGFPANSKEERRSGTQESDSEQETYTENPMDASTARAIAAALFARAGKGKDEVVQIIAREIGAAIAAMLKEPLSQITKNQKIQISFELVPKTKIEDPPGSHTHYRRSRRSFSKNKRGSTQSKSEKRQPGL